MPPKKSAASAHGMAKTKEGMLENEVSDLVESQKETKKPVARKSRLKAKKAISPFQEVRKVKIVSPTLTGKLEAPKKKRAQVKNNGIVKRKRLPPKAKPVKIKRILSQQEKIAFANQVAQAQLVPGTPIIEEPIYIPMEPPPLNQPVVTPQPVNRPTAKLPVEESVKPVGKKVLNKLKRWKTAAEKKNGDTLETAEPTESQPQVNGVVKKKAPLKKRLLKKKTQGQLTQDVEVHQEQVMQAPAKSEPIRAMSRSLEHKTTPVRKKEVKTPRQWKKGASKNTEAAATAAPENLLQPPDPQENLPPPLLKKARGRPRKVLVHTESVSPTPPTPHKRPRQNSARSTDESSVTTRENAKKLEENLTRPESKASDTFSWAADISSSSHSTPTKHKGVLIDGKLATVKLIDIRKHSPATSSLTSPLSDKMGSPRKARSPTKRLTEINQPTKKADKRHLEEDDSRGSENKRPRKERDETAAESRSKKTRSKDKRSRSSRRKNREQQQSEILRLEDEKRRIEELLKFTEATISNPSWKTNKSQSKNSGKAEKSASSSRASEGSSSSGKRPNSRESKSKKRPKSDKDGPKDAIASTVVNQINVVKMPNVESVPSSLTGSSSIFSTTESQSSVSTESAETNKIKAVLESISRALNNFDLEFIQWLTREDDNSNGKPIPEITCLKLEEEAIMVCQNFKRNISELSSSEKSDENKSVGSHEATNSHIEYNVGTDNSYGVESRVENASSLPMATPNSPVEKTSYDYTYTNNDNLEDDDDAISLFAESISGFDSVRNSVRSARNSPTEEFREPMAPIIPIASVEETPVVKTKTTDVQKQNADSSTYLETKTNAVNSNKLMPSQTVEEIPKTDENRPLLMADIYKTTASHLASNVLKGYCYFYLISKCKKTLCPYKHMIPDQIYIKNKLNSLSEPHFVLEYLFMRKNPALRNQFMILYIDECLKRDLTRFLVEMALDAMHEEPSRKTYIMETTLLHLNDKDLNTCEDLLLNPTYGQPLSDMFMLTIATTQNFSRFKPVFVKLTKFLVQRQRKIDLVVATYILERICILQYEEPLAGAAVLLIKNTSSMIFESSLVDKFLARLAVKNLAAYNDLVYFKEQVFGPTQPIVENVRYTSPDTTHLEALQNRPPNESPPATVTRTVNFNTPAPPLPSPLTPPMDVFPKPVFAPSLTQPMDNFVQPMYPRPMRVAGAAWGRDRPKFQGANGWIPRMRGRGFERRDFSRGRPNPHRWP